MQGVILDSLSKIVSNIYIGRYCYIAKKHELAITNFLQ